MTEGTPANSSGATPSPTPTPGAGQSSTPSSNQGSVPTGTGGTPPGTQSTVPTVELPDGRVVGVDQAAKEWKSFMKDYTQKAQELKTIKEQQTQTPKTPTSSSDDLAKYSDEDKRIISKLEEYGFTRKQAVEGLINQQKEEIVKQAVSSTMNISDMRTVFKAGEQKYNGENGLPKISEAEFLDFRQGLPKGKEYSVDQMALMMHPEKMQEYYAKPQTSTTQQPAALPQTERQGAAQGGTPPKQTVPRFGDGSAEARVTERVSQILQGQK